MKKRIEVIMALALLIGAYFFAREGAHMVESMKARTGELCIVIDAGHGGGNLRKVTKGKQMQKDRARRPALHGNGDTGARGTHIGKAEEADRRTICRACVSAC